MKGDQFRRLRLVEPHPQGFRTARYTVNPVEWLTARGVDCSHITYDPDLREWDYRIRRQQTHDGTMLFTDQVEREIMRLLALRETYYKPKGAPKDRGSIRYTVGPLRIMMLFGTVDINGHHWPGQLERFSMPVKYTELAGYLPRSLMGTR